MTLFAPSLCIAVREFPNGRVGIEYAICIFHVWLMRIWVVAESSRWGVLFSERILGNVIYI